MKASRSCDLELYQKVKESVSMQQAVEYCGLHILNGKCLCPFHKDTHPSMKIYPNGKGYYCFVCGAGGDQIKFVAEYYGISNYEAAKQLAQAYGISIREPVSYREKREAEKRQRLKRELRDFVSYARKWLTVYRGLLCEAIRERGEHFWEGLSNLTYVEYLISCLDQCPEEVYADKKVVREIGKVERRVSDWYIKIGEDGSVSR